MKKIALFSAALALVALIQPTAQVSAAAAAAPKTAPAAASASDVIKSFYAALTDSFKQGEQLGFSGRVAKMDPVVKSSFDLPLMTRMSVGPSWSKATADEQAQLIDAFTQFTVANYASQFKSDEGESFEVVGEKPTGTDGGVMVDTKIHTAKGDIIDLNYLMHKDAVGQWRVVDIFLAGAISQLATRRAEFSGIAKRDGIEALVNSLSDKVKQLGPT